MDTDIFDDIMKKHFSHDVVYKSDMLAACEAAYKLALKEKAESGVELPCICGELDTGALVNDPLYKALDKLYERGWIDKYKERDYDPRGTIEWQGVLDLFRLQKTTVSKSDSVTGCGASLARPEWKVKIKGDAGTYEIWAINWLYQKALVCRACGDEWVSLSKLTIAP